jgi:hypothetical protein
MTPDVWSDDALLRKARVYIERAESGPPGLWSLLGLELLARAALARVHPALLADPQEGRNLLYSFGFGRPQRPRSIPFKTVVMRCRVVVDGFTEDLMKAGIALMELRNEELHTGGMALEELKSSSWQPQYYGICDVLLKHLELGLEDLFPPERAATAQMILADHAKDIESDVKQRIADKTRWFEALDDDERRSRADHARLTASTAGLALRRERLASCPACHGRALLSGETAAVTQPRVGSDDIERDVTVLPTKLWSSPALTDG